MKLVELLIFIGLFLTFKTINGENGNQDDIEDIIDGGINWKTILRGYIATMINNGTKFLPVVSPSCEVEILKSIPIFNISNFDATTLSNIIKSPVAKVLDSWGKIPERILIGNFNWLGAYDECNSVNDMRYCLADMKLFEKYKGTYGLCLPKQCSNSDVYKILNVTQQYTKSIINFSKNGVSCIEENKYDGGFIVTMIFLSIFISLCLIGTALDIIQGMWQPSITIESVNGCEIKEDEGIRNDAIDLQSEHTTSLTNHQTENYLSTNNHDTLKQCREETRTKGSIIIELLLCFSFLKNSRAVLSTDVPKGAIGSINGIRTISMTWVIIGHYYSFGVFLGKIDNLLDVSKILHRFTFLAISNAHVSVDTFFLLSGLLVAYLTLKRMEKFHEKTNREVALFWLKYYLHRYIRLTPSLVMLILIYNYIFPVVVTGPLKTGYQGEKLVHFQSLCEKYWWSSLLYINNFWPKNMGAQDQCVAWTWYLANDMQFYIISPFILYAICYLDRRLKTSKLRYVGSCVFIGALCTISFIIIATIVGINDYPALIAAVSLPGNPRGNKLSAHQNEIYEKPYTRISPYLVGIFLGYLLFKKVEIKYVRKKVIYSIGWISAIVIALSVIYGPWHAYKENGTFFNKAENIFYDTFHSFAFVVAVAWVVYACHYRAGGLINNFLSWSFWIPLSRLTYGAYLLHPLVLGYFFLVQEIPFHFQDNLTVFNLISNIFVSYVFAFVMALLIEYPVLNVEKKLLK